MVCFLLRLCFGRAGSLLYCEEPSRLRLLLLEFLLLHEQFVLLFLPVERHSERLELREDWRERFVRVLVALNHKAGIGLIQLIARRHSLIRMERREAHMLHTLIMTRLSLRPGLVLMLSLKIKAIIQLFVE